MDNLVNYMKKILDKKACDIKMTNRLESHPCVVTVQDMATARHFIRTQSHQMDEEMRYSILQPRFEINPNHPLIKKLCKLTTTDTELADRLIRQVSYIYFLKFHILKICEVIHLFIHLKLFNAAVVYWCYGWSWAN